MTFTLTGTMTLTSDAESDGACGCQGASDSGFDDIADGTAVTVYNAAGDVVATGELTDSTPDDPDLIGSCTFQVRADDVPEAEKFYQVEVSHRERLTLSAQDAEAGNLAATLGD
jgi:hypothetical protein